MPGDWIIQFGFLFLILTFSYLEALELGSQTALGLSGHLETLSCALIFLVEGLRPTEVICPRTHGET